MVAVLDVLLLSHVFLVLTLTSYASFPVFFAIFLMSVSFSFGTPGMIFVFVMLVQVLSLSLNMSTPV